MASSIARTNAGIAALWVLPGGFAPTTDTVDTWPTQSQNRSSLYDMWVRFPVPEKYVPPQAERLTREIREWTGWSQRKMARALGTSHPTVRALEEGRSVWRVRDILTRLIEAHSVVERAHLLSGRKSQETDRLLTTPRTAGELTAIDLISQRRPSEAYLAVLDVLRPRQHGMMTGLWPAEAHQGTAALTDDEDE